MSKTLNQDELIGRAMTLVHDTWREASRGITPGEPIRVLPRVDFAESQRRSKVGKALLEQGGQIDLDLLPHELALTVRVALSKATNWSREEEWYWLVFDALGAEVPAMFAATPYGGGILLGSLLNNFSTLPVHSRGDRHRYLGLLADYAELIGQLHTRTVGQEERGIFMPRAQLLQSGPLLIGLKAQAMAVLKPLRKSIAHCTGRLLRPTMPLLLSWRVTTLAVVATRWALDNMRAGLRFTRRW